LHLVHYIGYTNDIRRRIEEHNKQKGKFTDKGIPWKILHTENFESAQLAHQRELEIKGKKSRKYIEWVSDINDKGKPFLDSPPL